MLSPRCSAQLGLGAACTLLVLSTAVLLVGATQPNEQPAGPAVGSRPADTRSISAKPIESVVLFSSSPRQP